MVTITFIVGGSPRVCFRETWDRLIGPKPPEGYTTDGCTLSPDYVADRPVWPACVIHDYHYTGVVSRWRADWIFMRNLYRLLRVEDFFFGSAVLVSVAYWWAVRARAAGAYAGRGPR